MIKDFFKKHFLIFKVRNKLSPSVQIEQRRMYLHYQELKRKKELPQLKETGFRVFSQFEEDGLLLFIFSIIGMTTKSFIEIGSDDGVNSNSANLYFHFGWNGLFIDGNPKSIKRGKRFFSKYPHPWFDKPKFLCEKVKKENINGIISKAGLEGEIGLLSIDIDGNDYWIWDELDQVKPQVVLIETHVEFGLENIVVPYDPNYFYPGKHPVYHGASPVAMEKLAKKKGYRLVGANELGFNFIFLRNDLAVEEIKEVSVESVLQHPYAKNCFEKFKQVREMKFVTPIA